MRWNSPPEPEELLDPGCDVRTPQEITEALCEFCDPHKGKLTSYVSAMLAVSARLLSMHPRENFTNEEVNSAAAAALDAITNKFQEIVNAKKA